MLQRHHYFDDGPSSLVRVKPEGTTLLEICILDCLLNSSSLDLSLDLGAYVLCVSREYSFRPPSLLSSASRFQRSLLAEGPDECICGPSPSGCDISFRTLTRSAIVPDKDLVEMLPLEIYELGIRLQFRKG